MVLIQLLPDDRRRRILTITVSKIKFFCSLILHMSTIEGSTSKG